MSGSKSKDNKKNITAEIILGIVVIIIIFVPWGLEEINSRNLSKKADLAMKNKNYKEAISLYGKVYDSEKEKEAQKLYNSGGNFNKGMELYKKNNYEDAMKYFKKVEKEDRANYKNAEIKIKECIPKYNKQIMEKANEKASNKDFYEANKELEKALKIDPKNKELISLKQKYHKLYSEKVAQEAKEAEAKRKAEAAAERERLKPKHIVSSDNYDVWKVYLRSGMNILKINVNDGEDDNVIADINGRNMINEIGIGNYANDIEIEEDGWYRLTISTSMGYSFSIHHEY